MAALVTSHEYNNKQAVGKVATIAGKDLKPVFQDIRQHRKKRCRSGNTN